MSLGKAKAPIVSESFSEREKALVRLPDTWTLFNLHIKLRATLKVRKETETSWFLF